MKKRFCLYGFSILLLAVLFIGVYKKYFSMRASSNASQLHYKYKDCSFFESLTDSGDYAEISALKDEILSSADELYKVGEIKTKLRESDIDFSKAVKIYVDNSLTVSDLENAESLLEKLSNVGYIWELPVKTDDDLLTFTFNIGEPFDGSARGLLTDEDIEMIKSREGHWFLLSTSWNNPNDMDYRAYVDNVMNDNNLSRDDALFVLVGGFDPVYQPILLEIKDHVTGIITPCEGTAATFSMLIRDNIRQSLQSREDKGYFTLSEFKDMVERK